MKLRRRKRFKRIMSFYKVAFKIHEPFRVIVDGTFIQAALKQKIFLKEQLPKMLEGRCTPIVTDCILAELRHLGNEFLGAVIIAKNFYRHKCGHGVVDDKNCTSLPKTSARKCILGLVKKSPDSGYFVASQDIALRSKLRHTSGVPLIFLNGNVPMLEEPAAASEKEHKKAEAAKLGPREWEKKFLTESQSDKPKETKKRKRKGVNPLSRLTKKHTPLRQDSNVATRSTRVRSKRKRCGSSVNDGAVSVVDNTA